MQQNGQLVPIKVRPVGGCYEVVYGHRRVEAARQLGWKEVEASIAPMDDTQAMVEGLIENVQRTNLTPEEEGRAYVRLHKEFGWSTRQIAAKVGRSQTQVHRLMHYVHEIDELGLTAQTDEISDLVCRHICADV